MKIRSTSLNLKNEFKTKVEPRVKDQEHTLSKGLVQPFNNVNSGSRKLMQNIQVEQCLQLLDPEVPIISTGFENQFAELSSNFFRSDSRYIVLNNIPKFKKNPHAHYWLIVRDTIRNRLSCIERVGYKHITEFFGFLYNNDYLDNLKTGDIINKGTVVKKTRSYDEYNNRADGINLNTAYISCELNKEDPIIISESASKKFVSPLIYKVQVIINDNDILLNLYSEDGELYKTIPNIGENIKNSLLCAVRRELKDEESLFSQSWDRLKDIMMNDKKYPVDGKVIDVDVYCNDVEKLEASSYNSQIKEEFYYPGIEFAKTFVNTINSLAFDSDGVQKIDMTYDLQKLYYKCKQVIDGIQYINDKVFNNIILNIHVLKCIDLKKGDKLTDRYGGKGVISAILPDYLMPRFYRSGEWRSVDVIYNNATCVNRENPGQLFETSINYASTELLDYIRFNNLPTDQAYSLIYKFISLLNPTQATYMNEHYICCDDLERDNFVENMIYDGVIALSILPISSSMDKFKLLNLYKAFPFLNNPNGTIKKCPIQVPMKDSTGNYRLVRAFRDIIVGKKYIIRLKHLAEEHFSAVSLASTNIKNENSKSKSSKMHNTKFSSTPIKLFGEMESHSMISHLGPDSVYKMLMLVSSSPMGRRLHKKLLTGDPFNINIELTEDCSSRSAETVQAFLKTYGIKFRFIKINKFVQRPVIKEVIRVYPKAKKDVVLVVDKKFISNKKLADKELKRLKTEFLEKQNKGTKDVVYITPGIAEETIRLSNYKKKLKELGIDK